MQCAENLAEQRDMLLPHLMSANWRLIGDSGGEVMLFEEKEANLLEDLRLICPQETLLVNDDVETVGMFNSAYGASQKKEWTDALRQHEPALPGRCGGQHHAAGKPGDRGRIVGNFIVLQKACAYQL